MTGGRRRSWLWLPPLAWMALVLTASSDLGSAAETGRLLLPFLAWLLPGASPADLALAHRLVRTAGHGVAYALLAWLWARALVGGAGWPAGRAAAAAFAIALGWAALDELHQATTLTRTASLGDVAVDAMGALVAAVAGPVRARSGGGGGQRSGAVGARRRWTA